MKVCVAEASGKLGQYMVHAFDRSYEVVCSCRGQSVAKLATMRQ